MSLIRRLRAWLARRPWHRRRRRFFVSHWLSSHVRREMLRRGANPRWRQTLTTTRQQAANAWTHPLAYCWIIPLAVLILAVVPDDWSVPYFKSESDARGFLEVLWQVDAAALALSVAVVVVALEVFSSGRSGSLSENLRDTALLPVAYVGAAGLLVNGLVLAEVLRSPSGGAATWTAAVSGLSLALLPYLFGRASHAIDHAEILKLRAAKAAREARSAVAQSLFDRIAYLRLVELCNEASVQFQAFLPPPTPAGSTSITSKRQGTVQDINIYRLGKLARIAEALREEGGRGEVTLGVRVGSRVGAGTTLLTLPAGVPQEAARIARRLVKL